MRCCAVLLLIACMFCLPSINDARRRGAEKDDKTLQEYNNPYTPKTNSTVSGISVIRKPLHGQKLLQKELRRKKRILVRDANVAERKRKLLHMKAELEAKGIRAKFLNRVFKRNKISAKLTEKMIERAKKKLAKAIEKGTKRLKKTRTHKRTKTIHSSPGKFKNVKSLTGAYQSGRVRGSLNPCAQGQTRRRGRCRCPYLSSWNSEQHVCECIYGTYRDNHGNCRSYL